MWQGWSAGLVFADKILIINKFFVFQKGDAVILNLTRNAYCIW
jgi:hypothetical protein